MEANASAGMAGAARLGLALSGGGLRASLFHIGVLARLAELDLLREVQVLSTVSGGSIVGALYYLHVRRLLEAKVDGDITSADYLDIVRVIAREFPAAMANNLRMRAFAHVGKNLRMFWDHRYSRSDRMAELYEEYLYAAVAGVGASGRVELPALHIRPRGEDPKFHPWRRGADGRTANDGRRHKVPTLVINATTLNTGHLFQFTASWMGEPPRRDEGGNADGNLRLRRGTYDKLPPKYEHLPLGVAVAASAAVPGIFPPLALTDLYDDRGQPFTPQLVDGGVHDNQGIAALFDPAHPCTHVLISDASGQMDDDPQPSISLPAVIQRSNEILMDRVREEQVDVAFLRQERARDRVVLLHLKAGIPQRDLTWIGGVSDAPPRPLNARTPHGVDTHVQELLAGVRTDLDAFTETECDALMADGYLIAAHEMPAGLLRQLGRGANAAPEGDWPFLRLGGLLASPQGDPELCRQLDVAARRSGKTVRLVPWLRWLATPWVRRTGVAALLAALAAGVVLLGGDAALRVGGGILTAVLVVGAFLGVRAWARARNHLLVERLARLALMVFPGLLVAPACALVVNRHLAVLNGLRLEQGEVDRLAGLADPQPASASRAA